MVDFKAGRNGNMIECTVCNVKMNSVAQLAQHQAGSKHRAQVALVQGSAARLGATSATTVGSAGAPIMRSTPDIRALAARGMAGQSWPAADLPTQSESLSGSNLSVNFNEFQPGATPLPTAASSLPRVMSSLPAQAWSDAQNNGANLDQWTKSWSTDDLATVQYLPVNKLLLPREDPGLPASRMQHQVGPFEDGKANPVESVQQQSQELGNARNFIAMVKQGDVDTVKLLIEEGIDVDTRELGCPALHWAIFMRRIEVALLLISSNAKRDLIDSDKQTALHICLHPRHGLSVLEDDGLSDASKLASELLLAGWSADACDNHGRTALHHAAEQGNVPVSKLLLGAGASPDILNSAGYSPSDVATLKSAASDSAQNFAECRDLLRAASWREPNQHPSPMTMPMSFVAPSADAAELKQGGEIDLLFRPLMAALCSFHNTGKHGQGGVELSQLASRLRPIMDIVGLKCKGYATHAMRRGYVTIRQSSNRKQHYVSIAPGFRYLLGGDEEKMALFSEPLPQDSISASVSMPSFPNRRPTENGSAPDSPGRLIEPSNSDGDFGPADLDALNNSGYDLIASDSDFVSDFVANVPWTPERSSASAQNSPYSTPTKNSTGASAMRTPLTPSDLGAPLSRDLASLLDTSGTGAPWLDDMVKSSMAAAGSPSQDLDRTLGAPEGETRPEMSEMFKSDPFVASPLRISNNPMNMGREPLFDQSMFQSMWGMSSETGESSSAAADAFRGTQGGDENMDRLTAALSAWPTFGQRAGSGQWDAMAGPAMASSEPNMLYRSTTGSDTSATDADAAAAASTPAQGSTPTLTRRGSDSG